MIFLVMEHDVISVFMLLCAKDAVKQESGLLIHGLLYVTQ